MKIAIVPVSEEGGKLAERISSLLVEENKIAKRSEVRRLFHEYDAFVFVGAMGICVRTIAPLIHDKHDDPAVVCVDSMGKNVVSVLSGHIGGANDLTLLLASLLGATPIITTQSDNAGLWTLDTLAGRFQWSLVHEQDMNRVIFALVNRKPVALLLEVRDVGTDYLESTLPGHVHIVSSLDEVDARFEAVIVVSPYRRAENEPLTSIAWVQFVPHVLTFGIGLAHEAKPAEEIIDSIHEVVEQNGLYAAACEYCSIDLKANEPVFQILREKSAVRFFTVEELSRVEVPTPSDVVAKHVGTASVCEAAAILGANHGRLLLTKQKGKDFTVAVAIDKLHLREGHIEIVGAGPGDPELVSVRGRRFLERADLILYAGSLVPRELTLCAKAGATVRSSADMNLEEQCALMKDFYDRGKLIVRLHTGDPCIFGAIQEQMAFFDAHNMSYHITPGISSFLAAAAELRSQFTIPERCQTIILTRGEGRTPMPEREKLHLLARSRSTMCIFLSASIVDDVQNQLLQEYPADTPVAACYHLTWPDQRIYRGHLKDLAKIVKENHLTLTTMIVVGEAIDNRSSTSLLYDKNFSHLYRK
ncbi:MAG: precorrin-4 C(11)-methyltransferase [Bacteroidaceae bacterium]|nr:precorrin-4 C(11)-methyltransferase [Bacteroidaceae bacterium]